MTPEMLIDDLLVDYLQRKSLREYLDTDILFILKDEPGIRRMKNMTLHGFEAHPKIRIMDVSKVLNQLPFEEALKVYKAAINTTE